MESVSTFYHPDHLGSSTVITDHTGQVVQRLSYQPFGSFNGPAPADGAALHHFFTGQELDAETSLYHLGARYYDPALGRLTQPDPLIPNVYDPQSLNPYSYARNNPLRLTDPTGLAFGSSGFGSFGDFVTQSFSRAWNTFQNTLSDLRTQTQQSLNSLTTQAMQTFQSLQGQARGFGQELGRGFNQGLDRVGGGLQGFFSRQQPLGFGTNLGLTGVGEFLGGAGRIERMQWVPTLFVDRFNTDLFAANVLHFDQPWKALGIGTALIGGGMLAWDLGTTFADPNLTQWQKLEKATIQIAGAGVSFGVGAVVAATAAPTLSTAVFGTGVVVGTTIAVTLVQEFLYDRLDIRR